MGLSFRQRVIRKIRRTVFKTSIQQLALTHLGESATAVIDVGARWGAEDAWWRLHPLARLIGFDPDDSECARLNALVPKDRNEHFYAAALGKESANATLYVAEQPACSSLFPPLQEVIERYPNCREIQTRSRTPVQLVALDEWWTANGRPDISFLKLDTQGSELNILQGAIQVLQNTLGLELEVEFNAMYLNQPLFNEVDAFLRAQGFSLWKLDSLVHYCENPRGQVAWNNQTCIDGKWVKSPSGSGRLFWGNAVYFRDYRSLKPDLKTHLLLASYLEACGDLDGAESTLSMLALPSVSQYFLRTRGEKVP